MGGYWRWMDYHTLLSVPTAPVNENGCALLTIPARSFVETPSDSPELTAALRISAAEALKI